MSLTLPLHGKFPNKSQMTDVCVACFFATNNFPTHRCIFCQRKKKRNQLCRSRCWTWLQLKAKKSNPNIQPTKKHPRNLTWQWKNNHLKMYLLFKMVVFKCHVGFQDESPLFQTIFSVLCFVVRQQHFPSDSFWRLDTLEGKMGGPRFFFQVFLVDSWRSSLRLLFLATWMCSAGGAHELGYFAAGVTNPCG